MALELLFNWSLITSRDLHFLFSITSVIAIQCSSRDFCKEKQTICNVDYFSSKHLQFLSKNTSFFLCRPCDFVVLCSTRLSLKHHYCIINILLIQLFACMYICKIYKLFCKSQNYHAYIKLWEAFFINKRRTWDWSKVLTVRTCEPSNQQQNTIV